MVTLFYICNIYGKCFMQYNASKWLLYSSYTHFYRASCEDNAEMFLSKSYFVTFMICKNDHLICFSPTIYFYDMNTIVFKRGDFWWWWKLWEFCCSVIWPDLISVFNSIYYTRSHLHSKDEEKCVCLFKSCPR